MDTTRIFDIPTVRTSTVAAALLLLYKLVITNEYISLVSVLILIGSVVLCAYILQSVIDQDSYLGHFTTGLSAYLVFVFALLFFKIVEGPFLVQKEIITAGVFGFATVLTYIAIRRL